MSKRKPFEPLVGTHLGPDTGDGDAFAACLYLYEANAAIAQDAAAYAVLQRAERGLGMSYANACIEIATLRAKVARLKGSERNNK